MTDNLCEIAGHVLCSECGHDIDEHGGYGGYYCRECEVELPLDATYCDLKPSDIIRAIMIAEPTEAEIERGARAIWVLWSNSTPWYDLTDDDRESFYADARVALRAARGLS